MIKWLKAWLERKSKESPAPPVMPAPFPGVVPPEVSTVSLAYRRTEFWASLLGFARTKKKTSLSYEVRSLKVPAPAPGVLPNGVSKAQMALDSQIADTYKFGAAGAWDGAGFMGYAYLAELTQIPEFRIPCEKLANDMTRKWGKVVSSNAENDPKATAKKLELIEAELDRLNTQEAFRWASEKDGEFGRASIWFDLGETEGPELATQFDPELKVKKDSLKGLRLIEPLWTYPNKYNSNNPLRHDFYTPDTWYVLGQEVHSSRFMAFVSRPVPDILKPAYMFGGISLIQLMWVCVENWMRTRQSVSDLIHAFSAMVMKTDLGQAMTPGGAQALAMRAQAFTTLRDNVGLMIIGENEELTNVAAPLGSLDKLQAQSQEHMAAIAGIPLIVLFGLDPAGLNATGDGQIRVYHQAVEALQSRIMTPNMRTLLRVVQMSLFEEIDETIGWEWEPLWSMTAKEQADIEKTKAERDDILIASGAISPEECRTRLAADPQSGYNGIDVDDLPDPPEGPANIDLTGRERPDAVLEKEQAQDAEFREADHPRAPDGKFGSGTGGASASSTTNEASVSSPTPVRATNHVSSSNAATLKAYTGSAYRAINGHLRGGKPLSEADAHHIAQLDEMLGSASLPESTTVFRGLGSLAVEQLLGPDRKVKVGQILTDKGFPSTSSNQAVAQQFTNINPKNIMMSVKLPKGSKALDISRYSDAPGEKETLIAKGAKLKVVKYDPKARKLEVELMPHDYEPEKGKKTGANDAAPNETDDKFGYTDASGLSISESDDPDAEEFDLS